MDQKHGQQLRGKELKEEMIKSQKEGEKFREKNQGADIVKEQYNDSTKSTDEKSKK